MTSFAANSSLLTVFIGSALKLGGQLDHEVVQYIYYFEVTVRQSLTVITLSKFVRYYFISGEILLQFSWDRVTLGTQLDHEVVK